MSDWIGEHPETLAARPAWDQGVSDGYSYELGGNQSPEIASGTGAALLAEAHNAAYDKAGWPAASDGKAPGDCDNEPISTITRPGRPDVGTNSGDGSTDPGPVDIWGNPKEFPGIDPNPGGGGGFGGGGGEPGGGGGDGGGGQGSQTDGLPPEPDCAADDKAREALELFKANAALMGEFFGERERGAFIVKDGSGNLSLQNFEIGPLVRAGPAEVTADSAGLIPANIVGFIHNHPSSPTISGPDRDLIVIFQNYIWSNGGEQEFRLYNITGDEKIYLSDMDNREDEKGVDVTADC